IDRKHFMKSIEAQSIRGLRLWYLSKKLDAIFFIHFFPVFRVRCNFNDQIVFLFFAEEKDQPAVAFRSFLLTDAFTFFTPDTLASFTTVKSSLFKNFTAKAYRMASIF